MTWQSIWKDGTLICYQGRERLEWSMSNRSPSGVTGVTGVARIYSSDALDRVATSAIRAIDPIPNGIYGVDLKEDANGTPNPTEINIGRFFTTIEFFTRLGLNMPDIYLRAAMGESVDWKPCEDGWMWLRSMDSPPRLVKEA